MSIQWADNFGRYGTGASSVTRMRDGLPYNNWLSQCAADPDPLAAAAGERCLVVDSGLNNSAVAENRIALPTPYAGKVGVAARFWFTNLGPGNGRRVPALFVKADLTVLASCQVEPNGALRIVNGLTGTEIDNTVSPVLSTLTWNHIETMYNGATGAMEVRLNGVTVLSGIAAATGKVAFAYPSDRIGAVAGAGVRYKDLVIWDGTGTQNNDFVGTVVCRRFSPNSDVTLGGWVPSTGAAGYPLLAKSTPDDTTYLSAANPPPAQMEYGVENLPIDVTSVRAIITVVRARKIDGGDGNLQTSLISNGDVDNGADRPITSTFAYWFDISEINPDTAAPWTPVQFDAMTAAVDRTV